MESDPPKEANQKPVLSPGLERLMEARGGRAVRMQLLRAPGQLGAFVPVDDVFSTRSFILTPQDLGSDHVGVAVRVNLVFFALPRTALASWTPDVIRSVAALKPFCVVGMGIDPSQPQLALQEQEVKRMRSLVAARAAEPRHCSSEQVATYGIERAGLLRAALPYRRANKSAPAASTLDLPPHVAAAAVTADPLTWFAKNTAILAGEAGDADSMAQWLALVAASRGDDAPAAVLLDTRASTRLWDAVREARLECVWGGVPWSLRRWGETVAFYLFGNVFSVPPLTAVPDLSAEESFADAIASDVTWQSAAFLSLQQRLHPENHASKAEMALLPSIYQARTQSFALLQACADWAGDACVSEAAKLLKVQLESQHELDDLEQLPPMLLALDVTPHDPPLLARTCDTLRMRAREPSQVVRCPHDAIVRMHGGSAVRLRQSPTRPFQPVEWIQMREVDFGASVTGLQKALRRPRPKALPEPPATPPSSEHNWVERLRWWLAEFVQSPPAPEETPLEKLERLHTLSLTRQQLPGAEIAVAKAMLAGNHASWLAMIGRGDVLIDEAGSIGRGLALAAIAREAAADALKTHSTGAASGQRLTELSATVLVVIPPEHLLQLGSAVGLGMALMQARSDVLAPLKPLLSRLGQGIASWPSQSVFNTRVASPPVSWLSHGQDSSSGEDQDGAFVVNLESFLSDHFPTPIVPHRDEALGSWNPLAIDPTGITLSRFSKLSGASLTDVSVRAHWRDLQRLIEETTDLPPSVGRSRASDTQRLPILASRSLEVSALYSVAGAAVALLARPPRVARLSAALVGGVVGVVAGNAPLFWKPRDSSFASVARVALALKDSNGVCDCGRLHLRVEEPRVPGSE
jgi:hypothetical protein